MADKSIESVVRALTVLKELNRKHVTSIAYLHDKTGLPKATLVRMLKTLGDAGYVVNDRRQGGYQVTSNVKALSCGYHGDPLVIEAARPWAIDFTRRFQWPIAVAILEEAEVVVRFSTIMDSPNSPFHGTINLSLDLLTRALGRSYLAFCPETEREHLLDLLRIEDQSERERIAQRMNSIRRVGYALRDPMVDPRGSNTLAMPIIVEDKVLATIGLSYFRSAYSTEEAVKRYRAPLRALSRQISAECTRLGANVSD